MYEQIHIIDVTLRDGGYLNNWSFSAEEVLNVCAFSKHIGVEKMEIGYLSNDNCQTLVNGCPLPFLKKVAKFYQKRDLVGMLRPTEKNVDAILSDRAPYIGLVRLPCTSDDIVKALAIAEIAHRYDIAVSINIIIASMYTNDEIVKMLRELSQSKFVNVVYFADSRGALLPDEVANLISLAKSICPQSVGFHAHHHFGKGIENSKIALDNGCTFIDGSMNGYGDGGGNASLGQLMATCFPSNQMYRSIEKTISDFCEENLVLKFRGGRYTKLCRLCALKNIDHIWLDDLLDEYGDITEEVLCSLPKRKYKTLAEVLSLVNCYRSECGQFKVILKTT